MTVGPTSLTPSPPLCSFQEGLQLCEVYSASLLPAPRVAQVFCLPPPVWQQDSVCPRTRTLCAAGRALRGLLVQKCVGTQGSKYTRVRSLEWRQAMWQAQDPVRARIPGLGTGRGWPCPCGTGLLTAQFVSIFSWKKVLWGS